MFGCQSPLHTISNAKDSLQGKVQAVVSTAYLGTGVVKDAWLWLVGLYRCNVYDGTALRHVLDCILGYGEVCQNVGMEGSLQPGTVNVLKLVHQLALQGSIVDQNVNAAPLLDSLIYNVPASTHNT